MAEKSRAPTPTKHLEREAELLDITLDSPALNRLIDEVRSEGAEVSGRYDRTYNRHNR
jgi:aryl carrier-like protein